MWPPAVPFDPSQLPGLMVWLDASQLALADGVAVPQLSDRSSNARHATQATGSLQPLCKTGQLAGGRIVRFDGVDDYLVTAFFNWPAAYTVILVGKANDAVPSQDGYSNAGTATGTIRNYQLRQQDASSVQFSVFDTAAAGYTDVSPAAPTQTWQKIACVRGATTVEVFIQGASNGSTATAGTPATPNVPLYIGASNFTARPGAVDIAEVIVYDHALTPADRTQVETYLQTKWGV